VLVVALRMLGVLTLLTGVLYPLAVTGMVWLVMPHQARGSLVVRDGRVVGSELIGQPFSSPGYFWGRPSATSPAYNGGASSGSNLGPSNPALEDSVRARVAALHAADPTMRAAVPVDLVTASASGLDPDISVASALAQVPRVARARAMSEEDVRRLVERFTRGRAFGVLGEPVVRVLELNLALDRRAAK
jgi:potassium-transporting ATPase KdpC subunit